MRSELVETNNGSVIILDDVYTQDAYNIILSQVLNLIHQEKINAHDEIGTAIGDSQYLSHRKGLAIDGCFTENRHDFLYFVEQFKTIRKVISDIKSLPFIFRGLEKTNYDESLLGVYGKNDVYHVHNDSSVYTSVYFLYDEKKFQGGDLIFDEMNLKVDFIKNRLVIFPSWTYHSVTEVKYPENYEPNSNEFRMSIATFYLIKTDE
mgnify:CR=1 FL=1